MGGWQVRQERGGRRGSIKCTNPKYARQQRLLDEQAEEGAAEVSWQAGGLQASETGNAVEASAS